MGAEIRIPSTSVGRIAVTDGSQGQLHREQISYAMYRGHCAVEEEEKDIHFLLGGQGWGLLLSQDSSIQRTGLLL